LRIIVLFLICLTSVLFAQTRTFERSFDYKANGREGEFDARDNAIKEAQSLLLLELGKIVEVRQKTITTEADVNYQEEVNVYTLGKVKTTIVPNTNKWDGYTYSAKFKMVVDTAALFKHLDNITKQKEQAHADSLVKKQRINNLEAAVVSAKNTLANEEKNENKLRIERDAKYNEMKNAETQRNKALDAYDKAARERDTERMVFEDGQKKKAENNYSSAQREYNITNQNWSAANERVKAARKNLETAESNLARETGTQSISSQTNSSYHNDYNYNNDNYSAPPKQQTATTYTPPKTTKYKDDSWKYNKIWWFGANFGKSFIDESKHNNDFPYNYGAEAAFQFMYMGAIQAEFSAINTDYAYFLKATGDTLWTGKDIPYGEEYEYVQSSGQAFMFQLLAKAIIRPGKISIEPYIGWFAGGNTKATGSILFGGAFGVNIFKSCILFIDARKGLTTTNQEEFNALSAGIKFGIGNWGI